MYTANDRSIFDIFGEDEISSVYEPSKEEFDNYDDITDFAPRAPEAAFDDDVVEFEEDETVKSDDAAVEYATTVLGFSKNAVKDGGFKEADVNKKLRQIVDSENLERDVIASNVHSALLRLSGSSSTYRHLQGREDTGVILIFTDSKKEALIITKKNSGNDAYSNAWLLKGKDIVQYINSSLDRELSSGASFVKDVENEELRELKVKSGKAYFFHGSDSFKRYNNMINTDKRFKETLESKKAKKALGIEAEELKSIANLKNFELKGDNSKFKIPYSEYEKKVANEIVDYIDRTSKADDAKKTSEETPKTFIQKLVDKLEQDQKIDNKTIIDAIKETKLDSDEWEGKLDQKFIKRLNKKIGMLDLEEDQEKQALYTILKILKKQYLLADDVELPKDPSKGAADGKPTSSSSSSSQNSRNSNQANSDAQQKPVNTKAHNLEELKKSSEDWWNQTGKKAKKTSKQAWEAAFNNYKTINSSGKKLKDDIKSFVDDNGLKMAKGNGKLRYISHMLNDTENQRKSRDKALEDYLKAAPNNYKGALLEKLNKIKKLQESENNDLVNLMRFDMLENTVFMDFDELLMSGLTEDDFNDCLAEVLPIWAGIDTVAKARAVLENSSLPEAIDYLEKLNTAVANVEALDSYYR